MHEVELSPALVRGAVEVERTPEGLVPHRLPAWVRRRHPDPQLMMVEGQPAGVRLALRTAATTLQLDVHRTVLVLRGVPRRPDGVYDVVVDGRPHARSRSAGGTEIVRDLVTGAVEVTSGDVHTVVVDGLPGRPADVEIWLPHIETTALVALRADAAVEPAPRSDRPRWLHHGSSISQGSNADGPLDSWVVRSARAADVELCNLGFAGSALLDPFLSRVLRELPADLLSLELGINVVNADLMRRRAFGPAVHGFLDTIRDARPELPVVLVSPLRCPIHERTPGPGAFDAAALAEGRQAFIATGDPAEVPAGRLTLEVVREELAAVVEGRDDPQLFLLDGLELYGPDDEAAHPLPDALHPDTATHHLVADRFTARVFGPGGFFPR